MTDRPILFSGPMVRATLDGTKTQTRRVLKPQPEEFMHLSVVGNNEAIFRNDHTRRRQDILLPYAPGDRLWVREGFAYDPVDIDRDGIPPPFYRADVVYLPTKTAWKPSIHMPRWASRITLIVEDVRVERVQDISEDDARAEGIAASHAHHRDDIESCVGNVQRRCFATLWDTLNAKRGWDANPWIVALTFRVVKQNIDQLDEAA